MDAAAFRAALEQNMAGRERAGIGTLGEKSVHAVLKHSIEPFPGNHEIKVGPYVADIVGPEGIVEIQTRGFHKLRTKLSAFLEVSAVTVVHPIPASKWVVWVDPATGEVVSRRKSPGTGSYHRAFPELYQIKPLLRHPDLRILLVLLDMEEVRVLDGRGHDRKKGSTRHDRIPTAYRGDLLLASSETYRQLLPEDLAEPFTSADYGSACRIPPRDAQTALNVLRHMEAVAPAGKQGRYHLYKRTVI